MIKIIGDAGRMVQWLTALAAKPDDISSSPMMLMMEGRE